MKVRKKLIPKKRKPTRAEREESKRFASVVSTGLLVVGVVVGLVVFANKWMKKEPMSRIRIVGRVILDSAEIAERAAVPDSLPLHKIDLEATESRLRSHPFISDASVYRGENGTLVMEIRERAPIAVTFVAGSPIYLDSTATALPYRFSSAAFDVPVVSGVAGSTGVDSISAVEAVGVIGRLRAYDDALYRQVSEVHREPNGEYTLLVADGGVPVKTGRAEEIAARLPKLDLFWRTVLLGESTGKILYVDLRWKGQVVVKWEGRNA